MARTRSSTSIALGRVLPLGAELESIAADLLQGLKYSFVSAAAHPEMRLPFDSLEEAFQDAIALRPPEQRWVYHSRARRIAMAPAELRQGVFGRYGQLGAEEFAIGGLAIAYRQFHSAPTGLRRGRAAITAKPTVQGRDTPAIDHPCHTTLGLYITEVSCLDREEDAPEGEEIAIGGLALDANGGVTAVGRFMVREDFEHGVRKEYGMPGRKFCEFHISETLGDEPLTYGAATFLDVGDRASFSEGLAAAWERASPILRQAVGTRIPGALAATVSRTAGWVLDRFVRWLGDEFQDDVFPPGLAFAGLHAGLTSGDAGYQGEVAGSPGQFTFVGRRRRYRVRGQWRMSQLTCRRYESRRTHSQITSGMEVSRNPSWGP